MSYLHTFEPEEQARLERQASLLEPMLFEGWERLGSVSSLLEVGCGTGAQMRRLSQRYPGARLVGVDASPRQLEAARVHTDLSVEWVEAQGESLPFADETFDLVCLFWVLEHVAWPQAVLSEVARVVRKGGGVAVSEVHNASLYFYPPCPTAMRFWQAYNQLQRDFGGNPDIGVQLPALAHEQGWEVLSVRRFSPRLNGEVQARPERLRLVEFWIDLLHSALPSLKERGCVPCDFAEVRAEMLALVDDSQGVIEYSAHQLLARRPEGRLEP